MARSKKKEIAPELTMTEKILACHGNLIYRSIAQVLGISYSRVWQTMRRHDKDFIYSEIKNYSLSTLTREQKAKRKPKKYDK